MSGLSAGQSCPGAIKATTTTGAIFPPDPDLDDLPDELWRSPGPFTITGVDEDGNVWEASVTREALRSADARRVREDEEPQRSGVAEREYAASNRERVLG